MMCLDVRCRTQARLGAVEGTTGTISEQLQSITEQLTMTHALLEASAGLQQYSSWPTPPPGTPGYNNSPRSKEQWALQRRRSARRKGVRAASGLSVARHSSRSGSPNALQAPFVQIGQFSL